MHPQTATEPALAACAAGQQGAFRAMEKGIWEKAYGKGRDFSRSNIERIARGTKINMRQFRRDRDGICKGIIAKDQRDLTAVGTRGTPAFYINGRFLSGAQPIGKFKTLVDEELAKAKRRIRDGKATSGNYYDIFVQGPGLKKLATP